MALMCFHSARSDSRLTAEGEIILLPYQDRSKWDVGFINRGNDYMNMAAFGNTISTYHFEAANAYEHCISDSFSKTNWPLILQWYDCLCVISSSPITALNKIVAVMQVYGAAKALEQLNQIEEKKKLEPFYLYHALLGEIYSRLNNPLLANEYFETAMRLTRSDAEKKILKEKIIAKMN
jgi:RNA polymerase sigma-70 factor (ECF subfamily)